MGRTRVLLIGATGSLVLTSQFHTLPSSSLNGQKADCLSLRSVPAAGGGGGGSVFTSSPELSGMLLGSVKK